MNYDVFHEEHEQFRGQLKRFLAEKVTPHAAEWEARREIPRSIWREMGNVGFLGFCYDPAYGGAGADELFRVVMNQEMAQVQEQQRAAYRAMECDGSDGDAIQQMHRNGML